MQNKIYNGIQNKNVIENVVCMPLNRQKYILRSNKLQVK